MRLVQRSSISLLSSLFVASIGACGGSSGGGGNTPDAGTSVNPAGTMHEFVVSQILLPTKTGDGAKYGLDLDGDGAVDNALGDVLSALSTASSGSLDLQSSIDLSVDEGNIIMLANLKATALDMATGVALEVYIADTTATNGVFANVTPQPCTDPTTPTTATCGAQLKGNGMFKISTTSPTNSQLVGNIIGGEFKGGPGSLTIQVALSSVGAPITLNLVGARADFSGIATASLGTAATPGKLAGGITQSDLQTQVLPAVATTVEAQVTRDCTMLTSPPGCGCTSGSAGATVITLFDKPKSTGCPDCVQDCMITLAEVKENSTIQTFLNPDIMLPDPTDPTGKAKVACLSVGVGITAVPGSYTLPAGQ